MIFRRSKSLKKLIDTAASEEHYKQIETWKAIYSGYYKPFHDMKLFTVNGTKKERRRTLNMAKIVSEELSKIIFTEKVDINLNNKEYSKAIEDILNYNRFYKVFQEKLERNFALGGLVLKAFIDTDITGELKVGITYVSPDNFIPIKYDSNGLITEGAFLSVTNKNKHVYVLLEIHTWKEGKDKDGNSIKVYHVKNELWKGKSDSFEEQLKEVPLGTDNMYSGLEREVEIEGLTRSLFVYIKPNKTNNIDLSSPLGIPIYSDALDTLYAIDVAFDSFIREFRLGRRRILIPIEAIQTVVDPATGQSQRYFDANDEAYQAVRTSDADSQKIIDNTVGLRVDEHIAAINALLNLLSMQVGFSAGTFTFDGKSVKTATEVVSEQSKTYQTKQSNENLIGEGLTMFIEVLGELGALYGLINLPKNPSDRVADLYWDDSIIQDRDTDSDFFIKLKQNDLVTGTYVLQKVLNFTEEQAIEMIEKVKEEKRSGNPDIEDVLNQVAGDVE